MALGVHDVTMVVMHFLGESVLLTRNVDHLAATSRGLNTASF